MNIFLEEDYRSILRKIVEQRKELEPLLSFQFLAETTKIPKSYISKVVTGKAHFNSDQIYRFCESLNLTIDQIEYLSLLLEYERSVIPSRQKYLRDKISKMQAKYLESKEHLKASDRDVGEQKLLEYFLDPLNQLIHICLSIPKYQTNIRQLATDLRYPLEEITAVIHRLEAMEIIGSREGRYQTLRKKIHLSREKSVYRAWRNQSKLLSLERLNRFPKNDDYSFSATFSASKDMKVKIQSAFLEFLKSVEEWTESALCEEAYQLNFDLFSWTKG